MKRSLEVSAEKKSVENALWSDNGAVLWAFILRMKVTEGQMKHDNYLNLLIIYYVPGTILRTSY